MNYIDKDGKTKVGKIILHIFLGLLAVIVFFGSWGTVGAGQRGVLVQMGAVQDKVFDEGFYVKAPFFQKMVKVDVRIQKDEVDASAASKDLQIVTSRIALNYHLDPDSVNVLWQEVGKNYNSRIIAPAIQEKVKAVTAKFTAEELIGRREEVKEEIKISLTEALAVRGIMVDEFNIMNFDFSASFNTAIEAKVTAEQNALAAKNKFEQVKFEAEQRISQAKGEAEAIKIQAQAITQQGGKDYVNLQWIKAWGDGGAKVPEFIMGSGGSNFLFNLNK